MWTKIWNCIGIIILITSFCFNIHFFNKNKQLKNEYDNLLYNSKQMIEVLDSKNKQYENIIFDLESQIKKLDIQYDSLNVIKNQLENKKESGFVVSNDISKTAEILKLNLSWKK